MAREELGISGGGSGEGPREPCKKFGLYSNGLGFKQTSHVIRFAFYEMH